MATDIILMVCEESQGARAFYWNAEKVKAILFIYKDLLRGYEASLFSEQLCFLPRCHFNESSF